MTPRIAPLTVVWVELILLDQEIVSTAVRAQ
jgi:hypothetical protein